MPVTLAAKNLRLLFGEESLDNHAALKIAEVRRTVEGKMVLDENYIPPALSLGAARPLTDIVRRLLEILSAKSTTLGEQRRQKAAGVADRVHFPGHCTEVERYYAAMDVYVNCSLSEGLSQSLIEALSAGLPLVVTDVGDSRHVADGECPCGVVVPSGAASELAGVLLTLLQDDSRRQRFSASARQRFEQDYALERMVAKHASVYCAVLEHALLTKCGVPRITSRT